MALAGPQLQSLDAIYRYFSGLRLPNFAEMTALTEMTLSGYQCPANFPLPQGLLLPNLTELSLTNCWHLPRLLITPGALTSLKFLRLQGGKPPSDEQQADDSSAAVEVQRARSLGDTILSLPSIRSVWGDCDLFCHSATESLQGWVRWNLRKNTSRVSNAPNHKYRWLKLRRT